MNNRRFRRPAFFGPTCFVLLLALCAIHTPLRGAEPENANDGDLGGGLYYFRVTNLAEQLAGLRAALAKHPALVVDLRGVDAGMADARALRSALLPADAKARAARFVLINRATGTAIPFTLDAGLPDGGIPGVLVIAPGAAGVPADVLAPGSIEDDQMACEAIARGAEVATLVNRQPEKKRYDEAVLERGHHGLPESEDDGEKSLDVNNADSAEKEAGREGLVTDSVLQTAVHVHRSLLALKKL